MTFLKVSKCTLFTRPSSRSTTKTLRLLHTILLYSMSQVSPEDDNVTEAGVGGPETGTLLRLDYPRVLNCRWQQQVTTSTRPSQRIITQLRDKLTTLMGLVPFSRCIWKWLRRKTRRWPKVGKRTLTEFLSSCVTIFQFYTPPHHPISHRPVYSQLLSHR